MSRELFFFAFSLIKSPGRFCFPALFLAKLESVLPGIAERTAGGNFGDAGVPRGLRWGCSGYPQKGTKWQL